MQLFTLDFGFIEVSRKPFRKINLVMFGRQTKFISHIWTNILKKFTNSVGLQTDNLCLAEVTCKRPTFFPNLQIPLRFFRVISKLFMFIAKYARKSSGFSIITYGNTC